MCSFYRAAIDETNLHKDEVRIANLFREISLGLSYIHSNKIIKIVHRDFKPENILLDARDHPKISDFGLATTVSLVFQQRPRAFYSNGNRQLHSSQTGLVGTRYYVAPELEKAAAKSVYTVKSDVYSLGVVFFEMCHPPLADDRDAVLSNLCSKNIIIPSCISSSAKREVARIVDLMKIYV